MHGFITTTRVQEIWSGRTSARFVCPAGILEPMRLTAAIAHEDDWYVARCLEVEVASQGRTIDEARANLAEALALYFEDEPLDHIPEPLIITPVDVPA